MPSQSFDQYVKSTPISQNTSNDIDIETQKGSGGTLSPSFPTQESIDPKLDWINMKTREFTNDGDRSTDIELIDYYSDGKTLNATLWLYFPFKPTPSPSYENVNYGMFINSDFNDDTGFGGIDYKVEISWNGQGKNWTKVVEKWSRFGEVIGLIIKQFHIQTSLRKEQEGIMFYYLQIWLRCSHQRNTK